MIFEDLIKDVQDWGQEKGITDPENVDKQFLKFMEEALEFYDAFKTYDCLNTFYWLDDLAKMIYESDLKPPREDMMMEFGDVLVTLCILAKQLDLDPVKCLYMAYIKISKRKGKTINGTFVKEEDLQELSKTEQS